MKKKINKNYFVVWLDDHHIDAAAATDNNDIVMIWMLNIHTNKQHTHVRSMWLEKIKELIYISFLIWVLKALFSILRTHVILLWYFLLFIHTFFCIYCFIYLFILVINFSGCEWVNFLINIYFCYLISIIFILSLTWVAF